MASPIGKSVTKGTDADSSTNPFVMLALKCKMIECSSIMHMGAHNRCSFEVTLKVNNKRFIANGPTILAAKEKASLAALRAMHDGVNKSIKKAPSKVLDIGEPNVETDTLVHNLSSSTMHEPVSTMPPQDHISNSSDSRLSDISCMESKNAKASTDEHNPIISSRCIDINMDDTCVMDLDEDFQDSDVCGGEDDARLLPIQQCLENVESVTLRGNLTNNNTGEPLKRNVILPTMKELSDSIPSIKIVNEVEEYIPTQEIPPENIIKQESIVDELNTEPNKALVADAKKIEEDMVNSINAKEIVKTSEHIQYNMDNEIPAHLLDSDDVVKDSLPNLNVVDTSDPKNDVQSAIMVTKICEAVSNNVEYEKNEQTAFDSDSSSGHRHGLCTGDISSNAKLNQCIEVQSSNTTYLKAATNAQDSLKDVGSNSGSVKEVTKNAGENKRDEENISYNLKPAKSPITVQKDELVCAYRYKSPSDELFAARSSSILNEKNNPEAAQETENSTKFKAETFKEDCNAQVTNGHVTNSNENEEKSANAPNPKVFSSSTEILEDYEKVCISLHSDNKLHKSDNEEKNMHSTLNFKKTCHEIPLKESVVILEKEKNNMFLKIDKVVYSVNVNETNKVINVSNAGSSNDKTIEDLPPIQEIHSRKNKDVDKVFEGTCEPVKNSILLSKEYNSHNKLEVNIDKNVVSLKETDLNIYDNTNRDTTSILEFSEEYDNPKANLENNLSIIDAVIPKAQIAENVLSVTETDLKVYENSIVTTTDRETISNLQTDNKSNITLGFRENSIRVINEVILKGTSLSNYKINVLTNREPNIIIGRDCSPHSFSTTMDANITKCAEMDKDSDLYQTNESIILPIVDLANSVDLPVTVNKYSVLNPFVKRPNVTNNASTGSETKIGLQKDDINLLKVKKIDSCKVSAQVGAQSNQIKNKETIKCVLNPFAKKIQTSSSVNIATLKENSYKTGKKNNVQNNTVVVDLVEEDGTKSSIATKPATKLLELKRKKGQETLTNPVSKKMKLDIISHIKAASPAQVPSKVIQLDEGANVNGENTHSTGSGSSVEIINTHLEMDDDDTVRINFKREQTINQCLSILLSDDKQMSSDLKVDSIEGKTAPVAVKIDAKKNGNNLNARCVKTTKIEKSQSRSLKRNPINLKDSVLEVPVTSQIKPPTSELKKPKTPAKNFMPKLKGKSPNIKPRFHPYRERYLQDLATKGKSCRFNNDIANPMERLNAICPGIRYQVESEMGPSHAPFFILSATMNGRNFYGHGKSKRLACLDAAKQILDTLDSGSTPIIEPIDSNPKQLSTGVKRNNKRVEGSAQVQPTNIPISNQTENNNNVHLPQFCRLYDSHSKSDNNLGRYVSPLPPRDKRIANVLPNKRQYVDQYSKNCGEGGFLQALQMQLQCGTPQGYNFDIELSRQMNFHFPGQNSSINHQFGFFERSPYPQYNFFRHLTPNYSENFCNGSPQFNSSDLRYILDNMSNNHQFSGHHKNQQHFNTNNADDYGTYRRVQRGLANRPSRNKRNNDTYAFRNPSNPESSDESEVMSNSQRQVDVTVNNTAPQPPRPRSQCINPEPPTYLVPNQLQKSLHLSQRDSDVIEQLILERFQQLTQNRPEVGKYKVVAGIVMTRNLNFQNGKVVAIATGTKCINGGNISNVGRVINDSHAEVIARRCLMKFLYTQLKYHCRSNSAQESIFLRNPTGFKYAFTLKPQVQFHLYISTAPCGDARVFSSTDDYNNQHILDGYNHGQLRTKIEGGMGTKRIGNQYLHQSWDGIQIGDPLHTMSCSDKIACWNVLGIQGGLLATLTEPIYLSSIVLGSMFHTRHLYRAVCGRLEQSLNFLPGPFRLNRPLLGQTSRTLMRRSTDITPCIGVNWTFGDSDIEIISLPAGREITNKESYLCKQIFFQKFISLVQNIPSLDITQMPNIYAEVKLIAGDYQMAKQVLFDAFQHAELGCWVKKPVEQNEFAVHC